MSWGKAGVGLVLQQCQCLRRLGVQSAGHSGDRHHLSLQFFAILEANYPETVKHLIVIRGESVTEMAPAC